MLITYDIINFIFLHPSQSYVILCQHVTVTPQGTPYTQDIAYAMRV